MSEKRMEKEINRILERLSPEKSQEAVRLTIELIKQEAPFYRKGKK